MLNISVHLFRVTKNILLMIPPILLTILLIRGYNLTHSINGNNPIKGHLSYENVILAIFVILIPLMAFFDKILGNNQAFILRIQPDIQEIRNSFSSPHNIIALVITAFINFYTSIN